MTGAVGKGLPEASSQGIGATHWNVSATEARRRGEMWRKGEEICPGFSDD